MRCQIAFVDRNAVVANTVERKKDSVLNTALSGAG